MPRRAYDPLTCIPSSGAVAQALHEAERHAERLRILLRVARELEQAEPAQRAATGEGWKEAAHAS
jgi:hypothetical protein